MNMLHFMAALLYWVSFTDESKSSLTLEHKLNLFLVLFDLRQDGTMSISELIIMGKSIATGISRLCPGYF